jgi:cytochrome c oxidase cbb3-type subunit 3
MRMTRPTPLLLVVGLAFLLGAASAARAQSGQAAQAAAPAPAANVSAPGTTPTPDAAKPAPGSLKNPYTGKPDAIDAGKQAWFRMSCYGCHGTMGGGGMGPNLTDAEWRYGGDDTSVFTTIKWGRPGGMPAWGTTLSDDDIFKVMSYVRSLYRGDAEHVAW